MNQKTSTPRLDAIICQREETKERFVVTLTDEEFAKLSRRDEHLAETLVCRHGNIELIIQRQGD